MSGVCKIALLAGSCLGVSVLAGVLFTLLGVWWTQPTIQPINAYLLVLILLFVMGVMFLAAMCIYYPKSARLGKALNGSGILLLIWCLVGVNWLIRDGQTQTQLFRLAAAVTTMALIVALVSVIWSLWELFAGPKQELQSLIPVRGDLEAPEGETVTVSS